jgi:hypothetical protein
LIDTVYQLCPPLFSLGLLRIDSPSTHPKDVYARDKEFFQLHPKRNLYIRAAYFGEFDFEMSIEDSLRTPQLHVLIAKYASGFHQVTPIYRGSSFFYGNDTTDLEILEIANEMQRRNGIDIAEWRAFEGKHMQRVDALTVNTIEVAQ